MKSKVLISILTGFLACPLPGAFAQAIPVTIQVLETFDYPGTGNLTRPQKINSGGDIAGEFIDSSGVTRGFIRFADGTFSGPIVDPNDTANFTEGRGINDAGTVCGDYSNGTIHGFFLTGSTFTDFDVAGALDTSVLGLNNAGDFVGNLVAGDGSSQAFISLGGSVTTYSVPGATLTASYQLNSSNESVGYFTDSAGMNHGFARNPTGLLRLPVDPPGSTGTILFGNNNHRAIVGRYSDSAGVTHGLYIPRQGQNKFVTFDYPGSTFTSLNGINDQGLICGRFVDDAGLEHGILARVTHGGSDMATRPQNPPAVVKPVQPSPSTARSEVPPS